MLHSRNVRKLGLDLVYCLLAAPHSTKTDIASNSDFPVRAKIWYDIEHRAIGLLLLREKYSASLLWSKKHVFRRKALWGTI